MLRTNGAAMNKYIEQQFAALRYEKNILLEMPMKNFCEFVKS